MQVIEISAEPKKIAEIIPPLIEKWYILSPPSNTGWMTVIFPQKSQFAYSLRPGAVIAIDTFYQGDIVAALGYPGLPNPAEGLIVFFNGDEQEEISQLYGVF